MATIDELSAALVKADAAGNAADAKAFADAIRQMRAAPSSGIPAARATVAPQIERGFLSTIGAPIEAVSQGVIKGVGDLMFGGQKLVGKGLRGG